MAKSRVNCLWIMFGLQLSFINANELLPFSRFLPETVVGNSIKPGRKTRLPAEAAQVFVSPKKRLLGEIVGERDVCPDEIAEETSDARLMIPNQLRESVVVVVNKNARNEVCIG